MEDMLEENLRRLEEARARLALVNYYHREKRQEAELKEEREKLEEEMFALPSLLKPQAI